ncbi:hypothetical protein F441_02743 [Phytophthora nicotianae CJ01A1]|uniref:Uncharacterized protein n=1 Tax=Phytophthora nicotianae CJ01A1 TaxID=1317063 RepID=W2XPA9_PHYNI|nr:hypothetical protein F441_02743 [Phytophthora nicotianae CJ01A1]
MWSGGNSLWGLCRGWLSSNPSPPPLAGHHRLALWCYQHSLGQPVLDLVRHCFMTTSEPVELGTMEISGFLISRLSVIQVESTGAIHIPSLAVFSKIDTFRH